MEERLIDYAGTVSAASFTIYNYARGQNGRFADADRYYVYLALARRYARIME